MLKRILPAIAFLGCSTLSLFAAADLPNPQGPSCRCEVPGSSSSLVAAPLEQGAAAVVFATGIVIVARRHRRR